MKILVTGSAGFLGQELVFVLKQSHQLIGLDLNPENISQHFIHQDLLQTNPADLPNFDLCIHLASRTGGFLHNFHTHEIESYELALLQKTHELCIEKKCHRLIYTSSINVFEGTQGDYRHDSLGGINSQISPYAKGKRAGELFVEKHFKDFAIVRPTNIFGKTQIIRHAESGMSHVIPEILHKLESGASIEVFGDGSQVRNFIHVSDVVRFVEILVGKPARGYFNLRSEILLSIDELVDQLASFKNVSPQKKYRPEFMKYEPFPISNFDIKPLLELGWQAEVTSLADGLR